MNGNTDQRQGPTEVVITVPGEARLLAELFKFARWEIGRAHV